MLDYDESNISGAGKLPDILKNFVFSSGFIPAVGSSRNSSFGFDSKGNRHFEQALVPVRQGLAASVLDPKAQHQSSTLSTSVETSISL